MMSAPTTALPPLPPSDIEFMRAKAAEKRATIEACAGADPLWLHELAAEAQGLEAAALIASRPQPSDAPRMWGNGGEAAPAAAGNMPARLHEVARAVHAPPTAHQADASLHRLALARDASGIAMALDVAHDAGATTAIEKMIAHQIAALHELGMRLAAKAGTHSQYQAVGLHGNRAAEQFHSVEACRNAGAAAKVLAAAGQLALTMDRLRHGARQTIVVQQTHVADGGKAVVAGTMQAPADRGRNAK
jgi:hypothetical protein